MDGSVKPKAKPDLSFWQIWNMSFGFFGIQIGFQLQNSNMSRIFQTLGAEIEQIPILWIAAPLTGLLVQPIIGHMSDKTWGRFGRRRPYFFVGAVLTTLALLFMPHSPYLWIAAGTLWILDASINVTMEPFRAFVGDLLPNRQRTYGFAMQSFFIGAGAVFAAALPTIFTELGVANVAPNGVVPDSVRYSFYVGAALAAVSVLWTVFSTREYSPDELASFEASERGSDAATPAAKSAGKNSGTYLTIGGALLIFGVVATAILKQVSSGAVGLAEEALKINDLYFVSVGLAIFGLLLVAAGLFKQRGWSDNPFSEIIDDMFSMPKTMRQLAVVQFFTWFALFAMWIYTTGGVAASLYGTTDTASPEYNQAANWVSLLFGVYNAVAAVVAFVLIPLIAKAIGRKATHALNLALGGLGLASFLFIRDPDYLWIGMIGVGFAWASIVSVPYSILSGALPAKKMGVYMGIFNFFIVIPQLLAASILGVIVRYAFGGDAINALGVGAASLVIAALATLGVKDEEKRAALA